MSYTSTVKDIQVTIEYDQEGVAPMLANRIKTGNIANMRVATFDKSKITVWVNHWKQIEELRVLSYCVEGSIQTKSVLPIKSRHVYIRYGHNGIVPVLDKITNKYYSDGIKLVYKSEFEAEAWIKSWAHATYLRICSKCAEGEVLNVQPRPRMHFPLTSK